MDINHIWNYIGHHWFQLCIDSLAILNVVAAGTRVMGWTAISDFCGKLELAITTMVQAALNRKTIQNDAIKPITSTEGTVK